MSTLIKLLALGALVAAVGAGIALASIGGTNTSSPTLSPVVSTDGTTTGGREDVSGPCDEAEHRNDPRCKNGKGDRRGRDDRRADDRNDGVTVTGKDISGPCDELEHVNDPRCTGAGGAEDNAGPGSGHSGSGGGRDDD
jgi:hypothetical protein